MKGVLLSGGTGSRLRPITHTGPKQLVPVANKPVLEYAIEDLKEAGVTEIGVVLGHKGREEIQELLGDGSKYGVDITYIVQGNPLGLAHAAGCARDFVGDDDFVMYLGDNILKQGISELVESFQQGDYGAGIALQEVDNPTQFGIANVDDDGNVTELIEKPDDPPTNLALIGIYVFSNAVFDVIERLEPSWRGELEITDAIQTLLEDGNAINSHVVRGWWKDTGKPEDILEANRLVLEDKDLAREGRIDPGATVQGRVELHETATIEAGATVRGPVSIAENSVIESGTYVGPYTSIGPNSTLEGVHLENSVVIGDSTISTTGKIVDSLLGRGANVGRADELLPEGRRLVVGENSQLKL
ncbi:glucose-1-phosphate thymidyltransferase [Halogeometricum pallidum JCM 14848]|uniref:Glucose-1-phosphate thymidyltransferase n=1 Tax=Halogeometricum pallidum JCM 14848 TaxID=1227487 RepID=M0D791_HALPD|nr:glucose-1-phosphate thymidylyltransferase [Halogeometricum pallidum]ELZ31370.1 glucose-1-phosphate thymidyltransferase [Halogeometricum pallidum JCM 14848]